MKKTETARDLVLECATLLSALRAKSPLVHCLTNSVVENFTANVLLAIGASPAMIPDPEESGMFAGVADALLVNVGTVTKPQTEAMRRAVASARAAGRPWVLDPVAVGALPLRTSFAREVLALGPAVVRGNASEIIALAGEKSTGKGVDSTASVDQAGDAAAAVADAAKGTALVTGAVDLVLSAAGERATVSNGTPLMTRVTGVGCAQGAVVAAFCAVSGGDWFSAATAAALVTAVAGDMAAEKAKLPGSFQIAFLDALAEIDGEVLCERARLAR